MQRCESDLCGSTGKAYAPDPAGMNAPGLQSQARRRGYLFDQPAVVVTTPPEILNELGESRYVCPVEDVTITSRMEPSDPLMTLLTVPNVE
jgi:hypothetical protein